MLRSEGEVRLSGLGLAWLAFVTGLLVWGATSLNRIASVLEGLVTK